MVDGYFLWRVEKNGSTGVEEDRLMKVWANTERQHLHQIDFN